MRCLDSSFIVDILRNKQNAVDCLNKFYDADEPVATTIICIYELISGIYQIKDKNYEKHLRIIENFLRDVVLLGLDKNSALKASQINGKLSIKGEIIEDLDILIAGICITNNCKTIVTKNKKHFDRIDGLDVETY